MLNHAMRVRVRGKIKALACLALWSALAFAADPVPTVLVTDFRAPAGEAWSWARRGLAELAVEAMSARGIVTVDRDLLSAVGAEHDLANREQPESLRVGQWLGAAFLLSGEVEALQDSRVRLSGTLTRLETVEQVGSFSVEGDIKVELQQLVGTLVAGVMKGTALEARDALPERVNPIKPEALMFFQQGVDACAAGKPALAVGFFRIATGMDPKFVAAREWEAQAYALGGLPHYAASLRLRAEQSRRVAERIAAAAASDAVASQTVQRVVTVLTPVVIGRATSPQGVPALTLLGATVEEAVRSAGSVRLYRPESLAASVAEEDRQLSVQFSRTGTSRYSRWLASDFVLYTIVEPLANGEVALNCGVMHAVTARRLMSLRREVQSRDVVATLGDMTHACAGVWRKPSSGVADQGGLTLAPLTAGDLSRLPDFRGVAEALDARMREPAKTTVGQHLTLAVFFASHGSADLAVIESDAAASKAETLGQHQALADFFASHGSADRAVTEWDVALRMAEAPSPERENRLHLTYPWASGLLGNPGVAKAVGAVGVARVTALRACLLTEYPASAATFMLRYREATEAFQACQWASCLTNAAAASDVLEAMDGARREAHVPPFFAAFNYAAEARADLLYLQGASARRLGDIVTARPLLERAQALGCRNRFACTFECQGVGLSARVANCWTVTGFDGKLKEEVDALDAPPPEPSCDRACWSASLAEQVQLLSEISPPDPRANVRCVRYVTEVWKGLPPGNHAQCPLADQAVVFMDRARGVLPAGEGVRLVHELARAYLRVTSADPDRLDRHREIGWLAPRLKCLMCFYRVAGFEAEGLAWAKPFLGEQVDADLGLAVIQSLVCENPDVVHIPLGADMFSRRQVIGSGMPRCDESLHVQMFEALGTCHKEEQKINGALASYWGHVASGASRLDDDDPAVWYRATLKGLACSPHFAVSRMADRFAARLALAASSPDTLREVARIKQTLGLPQGEVSPVEWYNAGDACVERGSFEQAVSAFDIYRKLTGCVAPEIYKAQYESFAWGTDYLEARALAATGRRAEAAQRFRRLSQELGTRDVFFPRSNGMHGQRPLGLLAADAALKLHVPESEWAEREAVEREVRQVTGWIEAAAQGDVQAKRELLLYSMESGKPLDLALVWALNVCGAAPESSEDRCLLAIALIGKGSCAEARRLLELARKSNAGGRFELSRVEHRVEGGTRNVSFSSGQVIPFWLARACAGSGDKPRALEVLGEALGHENDASQMVCLGRGFERVLGQPLPGAPTAPEAIKRAVLRHQAEMGDRESLRCLAWEGVMGKAPLEDSLRFTEMRLKVNPEDVDFLMLKSRLLQLSGRGMEAVPFARAVIAQDGKDIAGRYALGLALFDVGDTDGAVRELRSAYQCCVQAGETWHYRNRVGISLLDALAKQAGRVVK